MALTQPVEDSQSLKELNTKAKDVGVPEMDFTPTFSTFRRKESVVRLEWKKLELYVGKKQILKGISGEANPGEVTAIMGPSGAGKTTLLNVLAGRIRNGGNKKLTGQVLSNGEVVKPTSFRSKVAYVTQEDALFATATVREALEFSCRLRLPASTSAEDRSQIVNDIISSLGLTKCEHTMIGSEMIRGVSGGEKKRVAIGVELVSNPTLLFLDEPTSGLDSWSALNVVKILKAIGQTGCTILCSIHQPSSEVFNSFDSLVLLGAGQVVYQGPIADMDAPFNAKNIFFPPRTNVADFTMLLIQTNPLDTLPNDNDNTTRKPWPAWHEAEDVETGRGKFQVQKSFWKKVVVGGENARPGLLIQAYHLMIREFRSIFRDKAGLFGRFGGTAFLHVLFAILFLGAGDQSKANYSVQSHFGALVQVIISALFGAAQPALLLFPLERIIFVREKATGTYGTVPYVFAKLLVEIPLAFLTAIVSLLVVYWAIGFKGNFILLVLCIWGLMLAATSTAMILGSVVASPKSAQEWAPLVLVPQLLFLGLFIRIDQMPVWISWAQYLCSGKYALNLAMLVEFDPSLAIDEKIRLEWAQFLEMQTVYASDAWIYILVLFAIFFGFRILSLVLLDHKAKQL